MNNFSKWLYSVCLILSVGCATMPNLAAEKTGVNAEQKYEQNIETYEVAKTEYSSRSRDHRLVPIDSVGIFILAGALGVLLGIATTATTR